MPRSRLIALSSTAAFFAAVLAACQPVAGHSGGIGGLALVADRDRHLTVAWNGLPLTPNEPVSLLLSSTRPIGTIPQP